MQERFVDKFRRVLRETEHKILKAVIRMAVRRHDVLSGFAFMVYSWGVDDVTDYHVYAERSYPNMPIFGTKCERYDEKEQE